MIKNRQFLFVFGFLFVFLISACSNDEETTANEYGAHEEEVTKEALIALVEENADKIMEKDEEGYMATIHSDAPFYGEIEESLSALFDYDLEVDLSELHVESQSEEEAVVSYTERMEAIDSSDFEDQETTGRHILRPDGDQWKIFHSEQLEVQLLSEESIKMEGDYAPYLSGLDKPFITDEWKLVDYIEGEGEARAEYILEEENLGNYRGMVTIDYYEDGNLLTGLANFLSILEESLVEMTSGDFEFERLLETENEAVYEFSLLDDDNQADQYEVGRIFNRDDDFYIVRYTSMNEEIENKQTWLEVLRETN